jgi:predicted permease
MEAVPGVIGVSYSDVVPLEGIVGSAPWHQIEVEGYVPAPKEQMMIHRATVPPGHFKLMAIPLLEGRDFTEQDEDKKPLVMIVNVAFARHFFGGANPIGRKVKLEGDSITVVGMVKDSKINTALEAPFPFFYVPFQQRFAPGLNFTVFLKTVGGPMRMIPTLRREALALNQDANFRAGLMTDAAGGSLYPQKVAASLLSVVGGVSLLLAALGLYSVMSYAVSQRTRELGIRMALGARSGHVRALVVWEGIKLTAPGLVAGVAGALAAARVVSGMLVEVSTADPVTFGAAAAFLAAVAMLASFVPAMRATRVDPVTALRCE